MTNKKPNILQRKVNGAVRPAESYHETTINVEKSKKKSLQSKNQTKSIKVSMETYKDMDVLKNIEQVKFDYEIIQLLLDSYYKSMSPDLQRRFTVLRENM